MEEKRRRLRARFVQLLRCFGSPIARLARLFLVENGAKPNKIETGTCTSRSKLKGEQEEDDEDSMVVSNMRRRRVIAWWQ